MKNCLDEEIIQNIKMNCLGTLSDCLEWQDERDKDGYGKMWWRGKRHSVHRFMMSWHLKRTLESHELVCHSCDNPSCCTLNHLFLGTYKTNRLDCVNKERHNPPHGESNPGSKFTTEQIKEMFNLAVDTSLTQKQIGEKFGVSQQFISGILNGKTWRHLNLPSFKRKRCGRPANSKLTYEDIPAIKNLYFNKGWTQKELANKFNIKQAAISKVVRGESWK